MLRWDERVREGVRVRIGVLSDLHRPVGTGREAGHAYTTLLRISPFVYRALLSPTHQAHCRRRNVHAMFDISKAYVQGRCPNACILSFSALSMPRGLNVWPAREMPQCSRRPVDNSQRTFKGENQNGIGGRCYGYPPARTQPRVWSLARPRLEGFSVTGDMSSQPRPPGSVHGPGAGRKAAYP